MSNVVGIHGHVPCIKEANPSVVKELERLLELARSGEVVGLQCVTICPDKAVSLFRSGAVTYSTVGMLHRAANETIEDLKRAVE